MELSAHPVELPAVPPCRLRIGGALGAGSGCLDVSEEEARAKLARTLDGMQLIGRRHIRNNNSWMGNLHSLAKGRERCTLLFHPEDAKPSLSLDGAGLAIPTNSCRQRSRSGMI